MSMLNKFAGVALALTTIGLAGCSEEEPLGELEQPANTGPVGLSDFVDLSDTHTAVAIKSEFGFGPIQNTAKDVCGAKTQCDVLIFEEGTTLPTSLPYTERETASAIGRYILDRELGIDELRVNCPKIPRTPAENCNGD